MPKSDGPWKFGVSRFTALRHGPFWGHRVRPTYVVRNRGSAPGRLGDVGSFLGGHMTSHHISSYQLVSHHLILLLYDMTYGILYIVIISYHVTPTHQFSDVAGTFSGCEAQIGWWWSLCWLSEESENAGWFVQPIIFCCGVLRKNFKDMFGLHGGFLKWWYPTTIGFPTKNDHFEVFWGYHHLRKPPI